MKTDVRRTEDVKTHVKDPDLVIRRRRLIVDAAVQLFIEKGFHKTTTRQIAAATGLSIGSLYEYVASKEDILYLVCDAIHEEVERVVSGAFSKAAGDRSAVEWMIRDYFLVCDRMSDHILLIYQETRTLPAKWRKRVLENEVRMTGLFVSVLARIIPSEDLPQFQESAIELIAHNISVAPKAG